MIVGQAGEKVGNEGGGRVGGLGAGPLGLGLGLEKDSQPANQPTTTAKEKKISAALKICCRLSYIIHISLINFNELFIHLNQLR